MHTGWNQDQDREQELDCMKLCGSFQIMPEPGQGGKTYRLALFCSQSCSYHSPGYSVTHGVNTQYL